MNRNSTLDYYGLSHHYSALDCGALTRMTTKERTSRNLKPQVFPFPNTLLMLLCLEKKDFLLITFLQLLWGYYDGLCTSLLPSVSLFAASKLKNFYNQHFRWRRLEAQLDFFHSIMPYINFAYVHR